MHSRVRRGLVSGLVCVGVAVPMLVFFQLVGGVGHADEGWQIVNMTIPECIGSSVEGVINLNREYTGVVELKLLAQPSEDDEPGFGGPVRGFEDTGYRALATFQGGTSATYAFDAFQPVEGAKVYKIATDGAEAGGAYVGAWHSEPFHPCHVKKNATCTTTTCTAQTVTKTITAPGTTTTVKKTITEPGTTTTVTKTLTKTITGTTTVTKTLTKTITGTTTVTKTITGTITKTTIIPTTATTTVVKPTTTTTVVTAPCTTTTATKTTTTYYAPPTKAAAARAP